MLSHVEAEIERTHVQVYADSNIISGHRDSQSACRKQRFEAWTWPAVLKYVGMSSAVVYKSAGVVTSEIRQSPQQKRSTSI